MSFIYTKAHIADFSSRDLPGSHCHQITLDCVTPELTTFSVVMSASRSAPEQSTKGRNFWIIAKMLGILGIEARDNEADDYDDKATWARVRGAFFWFKMDKARDGTLFLRDVKACDPFPIHREEVPFEDIVAMFEGAKS